jgi:phage terminase large subunit-like protein
VTYSLPTDKLAIEQGCYLDDTVPRKIAHFARTFCIHQKDPFYGQPFELLPYQWEELTLPLFGWRRRSGELRFKQANIFLPKKQGKSTYLAMLAIYGIQTFQRGQVLMISGTEEQSMNMFDACVEFLEGEPLKSIKFEGKPRFWIRGGTGKGSAKHIIEDRKTKSFIKVTSGSGKQKSGFNANLVCLDEITEWQPAYARGIYNRVVDAGMARQNSLVLTISTANFEKTSIGYEVYQKAKDVVEGRSEDISRFALVKEVGEHENWRDPETWWKALPAVPQIVPKHVYLDDFESCKDDPLQSVRFRTLKLNQWCGSPECWITPAAWMRCANSFNESDLYGCEAVIGIDYARKYDLTALCVVVKKNDKFYVMPRFFIPEAIAADKQKRDNVPYTEWQRTPSNNLYFTGGDVVDHNALIARVKHEASLFKIKEVRYDPTEMEITRQELERWGYKTIEVGQSNKSMSPNFLFFEKLIKEDNLRHPDNPILNWNLDNCMPKIAGKDQLVVDKASTLQRMDGIDATCIALSHWIDCTNQFPVLPEGQKWVTVW